MDSYKEIVTKAVIGKSKKSSTNTFLMTTENMADRVLGCWVINHKFNGTSSGNNINVNGSFDVNVWYSTDNDTKTNVARETFNYNENLLVHLNDNISDGKEVIVRSLKQPTVSDVKVEGNNIKLTIDKELAVEVVGNTMIKVPTKLIEDDYEDITNITNEDEIEKIDTEYLK